MSAIILHDEIVHYEVLGRGRPLIFLHGWVGSWRYWIPSMQAVSVSFRTYALDLWGFGDTAKNPSYYPLEHQANLLSLFLKNLGIDKIALVGHGLGAALALAYAVNEPHTVDRALLIGLPQTESALNPRLRTSTSVELADWLLDRDPLSEAVRVEATKTDQRSIQVSLSSLRSLPVKDLLSALPVPCLMVYGQNDPSVAPPTPEQTFDLPEHLHALLFEGAGHFPMLDDPSKFNRLLSDFLALPSGAGPRQLQFKEEWKRRVR